MRFIDLHTHLIPELDDGSTSLFETIEMLRFAYERGTRGVVATPHMFQIAFRNDHPLPVYDAFAAMVKRLRRLGAKSHRRFLREIALYLGAENFISPEFLAALKRRDVLTLNGSRYLMVEFPPYLPFETADSATDAILEAGLVPLLAHVERYSFFDRRLERLASLRRKGCIVQINSAAVVDLRGRGIAKAALPLLENALTDVIASDGHDVHSRPPDLETVHAALLDVFPKTAVAGWLWENPARILANRELARSE